MHPQSMHQLHHTDILSISPCFIPLQDSRQQSSQPSPALHEGNSQDAASDVPAAMDLSPASVTHIEVDVVLPIPCVEARVMLDGVTLLLCFSFTSAPPIGQ